MKQVASFSPELLVDINMVCKEFARSKSNRAVRDAAWRQCNETFVALRADACAGEATTLLQQLLDPAKEKTALVTHLMAIAETKSASMELDLGDGGSVMYFSDDSEAASFCADHCMFWDDMVIGEVAQTLLDHMLQPIMNSAAKFFLSKCPGFCNATLGMPSEQWRRATSRNEAHGGPQMFSKGSARGHPSKLREPC